MTRTFLALAALASLTACTRGDYETSDINIGRGGEHLRGLGYTSASNAAGGASLLDSQAAEICRKPEDPVGRFVPYEAFIYNTTKGPVLVCFDAIARNPVRVVALPSTPTPTPAT